MYGALNNITPGGDRGRAHRRRQRLADRAGASSCRCCASGSSTWGSCASPPAPSCSSSRSCSPRPASASAATTTRSTSSPTSSRSRTNDFNGAAAISVVLLVVGLVVSPPSSSPVGVLRGRLTPRRAAATPRRRARADASRRRRPRAGARGRSTRCRRRARRSSWSSSCCRSLWLLLAATKTDDQLVHGNPLSFGSWHALRGQLERADRLPGRRGHHVAGQLGAVLVRRARHHARRGIPAGYALALTEFRGRRTAAGRDPRRDADAEHRAGAAALPRAQRGAPDRLAVVGHPAVRRSTRSAST